MSVSRISDGEIIQQIHIKDPWCQMPTDAEIGIQIRLIDPNVDTDAVVRIIEQLRPKIAREITRSLSKDF